MGNTSNPPFPHMLAIIGILLLVGYVAGLFLHVGGDVIHFALVIALVMITLQLFMRAGSRT